jgi:predicted dehydrogenase
MGAQAPLTASVIGAGVGGRLSLQALARSDRYRPVAAADLQPQVLAGLKQDFPGLRTFTDYHDMLASCPTDVVCVSTYPLSHEQIALDALDLPLKGILVEKPLGHTVRSGRRILEAVQRRGLPMAVPHGLLAKRTPLEIIERVHSGEIGDLTLIEIQCTGWDIINAGIHWLSFVVTVLHNDPFVSVLALCDTSSSLQRAGSLPTGSGGVRGRIRIEPVSLPGVLPARSLCTPAAHGLDTRTALCR